MLGHGSHFVPAAGHDLLLPLYDPLLRWLGREREIKGALIERAGLAPGMRVLDLGCGTGTLAVWIAARLPQLEMHGIDPDPKALALARRKARGAGATPRFARADAAALPYPDACFDRVLSSLVLHHLDAAHKRAALREVRRVLAPGGALHLVDFGPPEGGRRGLLARLLHHAGQMDDNLAGRLPGLMREAGLHDARQVDHHGTLFGTVACYQATAGSA